MAWREAALYLSLLRFQTRLQPLLLQEGEVSALPVFTPLVRLRLRIPFPPWMSP